MGTLEYRWEDDAVSGPLVCKLLAETGDYSSWETRAFLRPIFRWMKVGLHKDGSRDDVVIERAFAYVEWLVLLSTHGDSARNIPKLPMLQPSYALNTIVTASQRAGSVKEAQRAFDLLERYGFQPDVFTYTALIDVMARSGDLRAAIKKYEEMRLSMSKPNVVTYTTLIRAVGVNESVGADQCLKFLSDARASGAFDEVLFLEALESCGRQKDRIVATQVLKEINFHSPMLRDDKRFLHAVGQVAKSLDYNGSRPVFDDWVSSDVMSTDERDRIAGLQVEECAPSTDNSKSLGCLGYQTSQSVRRAVVQHDINRLIERIQNGSIVTVNDFETLIHQCRKRKWKEDVSVIVDAMCDLATKGWQPPSNKNCAPIPPQAHLRPNSKTYVSVVDAFMCCGDECLAWQVIQEMSALPEITRELPLYRKFVRGAYLLTNCDHIAELIALAHEDKIVFTQRMGVEIARMFGYRHVEGFNLLWRELPVGGMDVNCKRQSFLEELVRSCAYKNNLTGAEETLRAMLNHGFQRSASTETALFICCIQHDSVTEAQAMLQHYQKTSLMMSVPVYDSMLREFYFKYTRRGDTFDESSRKVAMKTLYARRAIFEQVFNDREALEIQDDPVPTTTFDQDLASFRYWCLRSTLSCAPLMLSQHAMQIITMTRDKNSKNVAEQSIRDALVTTPDPCLFLLRSVVSLRFLDLTFRTLGKLAKQLLTVVTDELQMEKRHAEYCVSQLPHLSVHIVKELDDVVYLHRSHRMELLAFCQDALDHDSVDKIIGFLIRRPELYNTNTATYLGPKFAEMFVFSGVNNVLMFYKSDLNDALEMRRQFVREVIELEKVAAEEEDEDDACTFQFVYKAIREFKLENELEFMPYVMQARAAIPRPVYADASATPTDESAYLKIPLALSHIIVVDSDETLTLASDLLMRDCVTRLGLDAEWRPDHRATMPSKCSILQVACDDYVFLFDFVEMALGDLEELFAHLFSSENIVKLGFAIHGDIKRLRWSFPEVKCFNTFANVLDFSFEVPVAMTHSVDKSGILSHSNEILASNSIQHRRRQKGLSTFVKQALGYPLSKLQQKSDWERRPLTPQQVSYAALDAYCLLMLQDAVATTKDICLG
ncbi:putative 3'-5' exonuclease domain, tetratricopeptide-like helical domain superfamily [Plasmopara halstedii]